MIDTLKEIEELGVKGYREACNVGAKDGLDAFLDSVKSTLSSVDILVCNVSAPGAGNDLKGWDANITLDLLSTVRAVDKVLSWMKEAGRGNIIILSSISGIEVGTTQPYAATKAALISYAKSLAVDHGPDGIRVNSIAPGAVKLPGGV